MVRSKPGQIDLLQTLDAIRKHARTCTACDLYKRGTQTVFGEGPTNAKIMLVGEQPGNDEDLIGRPFVGPAGRILDKAFTAAGLRREDVYLTNAVKHFKWSPSDRPSKPRIHKKPNAAEMKACSRWLRAEFEKVKPTVVIALGRTAALACTQKSVSIQKSRGQPIGSEITKAAVFVTWHPSAALRAIDKKDRKRILAEMTGDIKSAMAYISNVVKGTKRESNRELGSTP